MNSKMLRDLFGGPSHRQNHPDYSTASLDFWRTLLKDSLYLFVSKTLDRKRFPEQGSFVIQVSLIQTSDRYIFYNSKCVCASFVGNLTH